MKIKLLFAAVDIGWRIPLYSSYLQDHFKEKIKIESFVKYKVPDSQYKAKYTYQYNFPSYPSLIQWFLAFWIFIRSLFRYSHFYFLSGETLLTRKLRPMELRIYKILGKKVIFHFVGSDIRDPDFIRWKANHINDYLLDPPGREKSKAWQKKLIADAEKYADQIFVSTPDLLELCPSAQYFPLVLDDEKFLSELKLASNKDSFFKSDKVKILHAPSNSEIKGSKHIDETIEKLKGKIDFEYINAKQLNLDSGTTYPVSRYQLFQLYQEADIVIDQMIIGWYGAQSIEAVLSQCKVICYIDEELKSHLDKNCPIVSSDVNQLEEVISSLVNSKQTIDEKTSNEWFIQHHKLENIGSILIESLS